MYLYSLVLSSSLSFTGHRPLGHVYFFGTEIKVCESHFSCYLLTKLSCGCLSLQNWARFSAPVQNGPGVHLTSCTMGTGSSPRVKGGRGVWLTPQNLLVPWSWKSRAIPLLSLWPVRPVQGGTLPLPILPTFISERTQYCHHVIV